MTDKVRATESRNPAIRLAEKLQWEARWKAENELRRLVILPRVRLAFLWWGVQWGKGWKLYGLPIVQKHRHATLTIGERLQLRSTARSNPLGSNRPVILSARKAHASLTIGDDFAMTGGSIVAEQRIRIGHRVAVGANTIICDTDFHPLTPAGRRHDPGGGNTAPIVIEDDVFIGMQCLILKGVTIGAGSLIGAGSVVTHDIPAGAIAAGNPARVIRTVRGAAHRSDDELQRGDSSPELLYMAGHS